MNTICNQGDQRRYDTINEDLEESVYKLLQSSLMKMDLACCSLGAASCTPLCVTHMRQPRVPPHPAQLGAGGVSTVSE